MSERGILAVAAYIPSYRIARRTIAEAMGWTSSAPPRDAGERSFANWDEDSITMGVAAARRIGRLTSVSQTSVSQLTLASTTLPFADRSNATIVAGALALHSETATQDLTGSQRVTTGAILSAMRGSGTELIIASDKRRTKPGSPQETRYGHGAAACVVGDGEPVLRFLSSGTMSSDFVDHYRASHVSHDYELEARWVRDEGHTPMLVEVIERALAAAQLNAGAVQALILPVPSGSARRVAGGCGIDRERLVDPLNRHIGECGAPHSLLMLETVLPTLAEGDIVVLCGFGQGADALVLQRTAQPIDQGHPPAQPIVETRYAKFLSMCGELDVDWGMRAERDNRTALSARYRRRDAVDAFVGGQCKQCGTPQFPRARVCVSCEALESQTPYAFSHRSAKVKSFTEDWQAFTRSPPLIYGNVSFEGGGNVYMEFADTEAGSLKVGDRVTPTYRVKDIDTARGFHRYFWKAQPHGGA